MNTGVGGWTLKKKLLIMMLGVGLVPLLIAGSIVGSQGADALNKAATDNLTSTVAARRAHVEEFFATIRDQVITLSESGMTVTAMKQFTKNFDSLPLVSA